MMFQHDSPQVSVIIPVYNRKHLIQKAVESVLNQTYSNYELIIIDDASTDGTAEFVSETYLRNNQYPQIRLIALTENRGASGARDEGIRASRGNLVAFLDSDDQWNPDFLEKHIQILERHQNCVLSFSNTLEIDKNGKEFCNFKHWRGYPKITHHLFLFEEVIYTMSVVVVRREALLKAGKFNKNLKICQDVELYLRLLNLGYFYHISENLVARVHHSGNLIGDCNGMANDYKKLSEIFFSNAQNAPYKHLESELNSYLFLKMARLGWYFYRDNLFVLKMLIQATRYSPRYIVQALLRSPSRAADDLWEKLEKVGDGGKILETC